MFKNKHVTIALLVAPVLALMAYFATDYYVKEKPHEAKSGQSYKMVEKPNCRYTSGKCDLKNGNFNVRLTVEEFQENRMRLKLDSNFDLDGAKIAIAQTQNSNPIPVDMQPESDSRKSWLANIYQPASESSRLLLVIATQGSTYFAETATAFVHDDRRFTTR